jgi:hypothetical protein
VRAPVGRVAAGGLGASARRATNRRTAPPTDASTMTVVHSVLRTRTRAASTHAPLQRSTTRPAGPAVRWSAAVLVRLAASRCAPWTFHVERSSVARLELQPTLVHHRYWVRTDGSRGKPFSSDGRWGDVPRGTVRGARRVGRRDWRPSTVWHDAPRSTWNVWTATACGQRLRPSISHTTFRPGGPRSTSRPHGAGGSAGTRWPRPTACRSRGASRRCGAPTPRSATNTGPFPVDGVT